jgi:hypothetical protein
MASVHGVLEQKTRQHGHAKTGLKQSGEKAATWKRWAREVRAQ